MYVHTYNLVYLFIYSTHLNIIQTSGKITQKQAQPFYHPFTILG